MISTAGSYRYVQTSETPISRLNITPYNPNIIGKDMLFCIPASAFRGQCASLQNMYISGDIGIYLFENNQLVAAINGKQGGNEDLKGFSRGEIVHGCYQYDKDDFPQNPEIQAFNRGSAVLVLYSGKVPDRCK